MDRIVHTTNTNEYCPACSGHGTNVHECAENRSVVVSAKDLELVLDLINNQADTADLFLEPDESAAIGRLWDAVDPTDYETLLQVDS